jgi:hypothetical protein
MGVGRVLTRLFPTEAMRARERHRTRLRLEALEERANPSDLTWIGINGGAWSDPSNWDQDRLPTASDTLHFGPGANTSSSDDIQNLTVFEIVCDSNYTGTISIGDVQLNVTRDFISYGQVAIGPFGPMELDVGRTFDVHGHLSTDGMLFDVPVISAGTLSLETGSSWFVNARTAVNADVEQAGTLDMVGRLDISGAYHLLPAGVVTLNGDDNDEIHYSGLTPIQLDGTVYLDGGLIASNAGVNLTGSLLESGFATVQGTLTNVSGRIDFVGGPNNSNLTVTGDFTQLINGTLIMHVWMGEINDQLNVGGVLHLGPPGTAGQGGTLTVIDAGVAGLSTFHIINVNGFEGTFTTIDLPPTVWVIGWVTNPPPSTYQYSFVLGGDGP